jgi:hypothetical protein
MELILYAVTKVVHLIKENIEFDLKKSNKNTKSIWRECDEYLLLLEAVEMPVFRVVAIDPSALL